MRAGTGQKEVSLEIAAILARIYSGRLELTSGLHLNVWKGSEYGKAKCGKTVLDRKMASSPEKVVSLESL